MAIKKGCVVGGCRTVARPGANVCTDHLHTLALQAEIVRLTHTQPGGVSALVRHHKHLRRLIEDLAELSYRADPLKASSVQVVARSRGHHLSDGIVLLGDHIATPGYAVSVKKDQGRLGAAMDKVKTCANQVAEILQPRTALRDVRPRCGSRACDGRNVRQPVGIKLCGFCGRDMRTKVEVGT